jgi:hypothetical protein
MDEMRESGIDIGLENIRTRLADNHSYKAAEAAKKWADQLNEWATKLEGEKDSDGGGGGGEARRIPRTRISNSCCAS